MVQAQEGLGRARDSKSGVPVRIQYAVARNRQVSLGVVSYSGRAGLSHRFRTRLRSALGPPSVSLKPQSCVPQIAVSASRLATARGLADSMQRCRLNSKSLANLLCTHAL